MEYGCKEVCAEEQVFTHASKQVASRRVRKQASEGVSKHTSKQVYNNVKRMKVRERERTRKDRGRHRRTTWTTKVRASIYYLNY